MNYTIILAENMNTIDFSQVAETSEDTVRYSLDRSQFIVKFEGNTPSFLQGKQIYTYEEILDTLNSPIWTQED